MVGRSYEKPTCALLFLYYFLFEENLPELQPHSAFNNSHKLSGTQRGLCGPCC
jgi:hypothetical protein